MGTGTLSGQCRYISNNMALFKVTLITNSKYVKAKFANICWVNFANTIGLWSVYERQQYYIQTSSLVDKLKSTKVVILRVKLAMSTLPTWGQKRYPESKKVSWVSIISWDIALIFSKNSRFQIGQNYPIWTSLASRKSGILPHWFW